MVLVWSRLPQTFVIVVHHGLENEADRDFRESLLGVERSLHENFVCVVDVARV